MEKGLSVRFFGGFDVRRGDQTIRSFEYDKVRALLAYLVLELPVAHSRETIAELFWPNERQEAARHSLRQAVLTLRTLLQDESSETPLILTTRTSIQRNPDAELQSDVEMFEDCVKDVSSTEAQELERLERAASLYRGELLQGLSYAGGDAFEQWLLPKRQYYQRLAVDLFDRLLRHYEKVGDYRRASQYAERLLSIEPWREEAHRQLMFLLARTGQHSAALRQYQVCRSNLQESFGVVPQPETERAYSRIRDAASARFNLPAEQTPFIGREQEIATLMRFLSDRSHSLITITGLGGMGKTRLAIRTGMQAASEQGRLFLHGVYFVPLTGIVSLNHLQSAIAQSLGLALSGDENPEVQLLRFLREKEVLIILDNFENLIDDATLAFINRILESASSLQLLLTSRQSLNLRSEQVFPVTGLPVPESDQAISADTDAAASVRLFISVMKRMRPQAQRGSNDVWNINRICRMLEGMPLAIELAAAWTHTLSSLEIAERIRRSLDILQRDSPDLPSRHRNVRAAFEGSWIRLGKREKRALAGLSVFVGGFTRHAFETITGENIALLLRLVNLSFVQTNPRDDRYHLHELLRQFSAEKLSRADTDRLRNSHTRYFCLQMRALEHDLMVVGDEPVLKIIDADYENINLAWHWAVEQRRTLRIAQMATLLHHYYSRRGRYQEGLEAFAAGLSVLKNQDGPAVLLTRARVLAYQADLYRETGRSELARTGLQRSLRIVEKCGRHNAERHRAFILSKLGLLTSEAEEARELLKRSLAIYRRIGDKPRTAAVLVSLGLWSKSNGDTEEAKNCFEESLALLKNCNSPAVVAEASYNLAGLHLRQGDYGPSEELFLEGIQLSRESNDLAETAQGLFLLSHAYFYTGKFELMESVLLECLEIQERLGQQAQVALSTAFLGFAFLHLGQYRAARRTGSKAVAAAREHNFAPAAGIGLGVLACIAVADGSYAHAYDLAKKSMKAYESGWQEDWRARQAVVQAFGGLALCLNDDIPNARIELSEALKAALDVRSLIALITCLPGAALLLMKEGLTEKGIETYALAKTQPHVAKSIWFSSIVENRIAAAAAHLPAPAASNPFEGRERGEFWAKSRSILLAFQDQRDSPAMK